MSVDNPARKERFIRLGKGISIPEKELRFAAARSSGPGGQNVNKVSTRVTLLFDINGSSALSEEVKRKLLERLATRVNREGILRVVSQRHRSQSQNRKDAIARFVELIGAALDEQSPRIETKIPDSVKRRRLDDKQRRSRLKRLRSGEIQTEE